MTNVNVNNLPYEYMVQMEQNNSRSGASNSTETQETNFVDEINQRLGSGDKTAIQELEAKGIPAIVAEMENGYKVQYTYGRVNYTVTYFAPSESNQNIPDANKDSTNTAQLPDSAPITLPEKTPEEPDAAIPEPDNSSPTGDSVIEQPTVVPDEPVTTPPEEVPVEGLVDPNDEDMWKIIVGAENVSKFTDAKTGKFSVAEAKAWCATGFNYVQGGRNNINQIAPGLFQIYYDQSENQATNYCLMVYDPTTKELHYVMNYEVLNVDITDHSGNTVKAGTIVGGENTYLRADDYYDLVDKSDYLKNAIDTYVREGLFKAEKLSFDQEGVSGERNAAIYHSDGDVSPEYIEKVKQTYNHYIEHSNWWGANFDIITFQRTPELRPGVWGNPPNDVLYYFDGVNIKKVDKDEPVNELINECIESLITSDGLSREIQTEAFTQLYLALTGKSQMSIIELDDHGLSGIGLTDRTSLDLYYGQNNVNLSHEIEINSPVRPSNKFVVVEDEKEFQEFVNDIKELAEQPKIISPVENANDIFKSDAAIDWLVAYFGLNNPKNYGYGHNNLETSAYTPEIRYFEDGTPYYYIGNDSTLVNVGEVEEFSGWADIDGKVSESLPIVEQDGERYFTAESAYKYWYENHYTPNGLGGTHSSVFPDKTLFANFLYAVCQTDYYCGSTGEFRDRINEYFKSIGGITTDGVNYMVTFEQLLKAYINLQNMPEGFYVASGDKDNLFIIETPNDEEDAEVINDRIVGIYNDACEDIISYGDILD